jgi:hypothetical protein
MGSTFWGVWKYVGCTRENAAPIIPSNVGVILFLGKNHYYSMN